MPQPDVRGRFLWHELITPDVEKASSFYPKVISWKTEAWPQDKNYTMWMAERGPVGGLTSLPNELAAQGVPPHWLIYIGTPNVDETIDTARRLGGTVMRAAHDVTTIGRFAVLTDPQGVAFAIYSPSSPSAALDADAPVGHFSWHELATTDAAAALDFYQELFGWDIVNRMDMGPAGFYNIFGWEGQQRGGIYTAPTDYKARPHWLSYARVTSADTAAETAKSAGATIINGPMEVPGGSRITMLLDPQGAAFAVHSMPAAPAKPKAVAKKKAAPKARAKVRVKAKAKRAPAKRAAPKRKAKRRARKK
jgi:predicted enzyme related to lactoylglutathione lyase